jgi:hypothetical protein
MYMEKKLKYIIIIGFALCLIVFACRKTEYSFGKILTPSNLAITTAIQGVDANHPAGDGSGNVTVTVTANNALIYKIYPGNGDSVISATGSFTYKYTQLDTNTYTITANAVGTGGATSSVTAQVKVLYLFVIPDFILADLTGGTSKKWKIASDTAGHFGVGPNTTFTPDYYKAQPNEKPPCAYDDEITFTQVGSNGMTMSVDNKGESFLIGASVVFYGQSGTTDGCYAISTGGVKTLAFGTANTGSSAANSTGIQFTVPGNGIVNFGTGGKTYEILSISTGVMSIRNIGIDGNAWYQILRAE